MLHPKNFVVIPPIAMLLLPQIIVLKQVADMTRQFAITFSFRVASAPTPSISSTFAFMIAITIVCLWCSLSTALHMKSHALQSKPHCPVQTAAWKLPFHAFKVQSRQ
jgi:hypothetical protein